MEQPDEANSYADFPDLYKFVRRFSKLVIALLAIGFSRWFWQQFLR